MKAKAVSVFGFLMYLAVMSLPLQGLSILGGDHVTIGFEVMWMWYPLVLILSALLTIGALATTFLSQAKLKKVGLGLGVAGALTAIAFTLFLEKGINVLQVGWILSGILLAVGNAIGGKSASAESEGPGISE